MSEVVAEDTGGRDEKCRAGKPQEIDCEAKNEVGSQKNERKKKAFGLITGT